MSGRYIRQKREGMRDPTMTHVEDPSVFEVGHLVRSYSGWQIIADIREEQFGDPMTRFITLEPYTRYDVAYLDSQLPASGLHDLRPYDVENFHHSALLLDGRRLAGVVTLDEARDEYERTMSERARGFIK